MSAPSFAYTLARRHERGAHPASADVAALRDELRKAHERVAFLEVLLGISPGEEVRPLRAVQGGRHGE
jgi:hypothetical protein